MSNLSKEIVEKIKEEAKENYEPQMESLRRGYRAGATKWAEMMIGFGNFLANGYWRGKENKDGSTYWYNGGAFRLTTSELLNIYINQTKNKEK